MCCAPQHRIVCDDEFAFRQNENLLIYFGTTLTSAPSPSSFREAGFGGANLIFPIRLMCEQTETN